MSVKHNGAALLRPAIVASGRHASAHRGVFSELVDLRPAPHELKRDVGHAAIADACGPPAWVDAVAATGAEGLPSEAEARAWAMALHEEGARLTLRDPSALNDSSRAKPCRFIEQPADRPTVRLACAGHRPSWEQRHEPRKQIACFKTTT